MYVDVLKLCYFSVDLTMEGDDPDRKKWEDLDVDILLKIFQTFDIFELTSGIARVCSTWRYAACDPLLWRTLDLSMLKSNFIKIPLEPYVYVDARSDKTLTRVLKIALSLGHGNISSLIFHFNLYVSDDQLTYTAERYHLKPHFYFVSVSNFTVFYSCKITNGGYSFFLFTFECFKLSCVIFETSQTI